MSNLSVGIIGLPNVGKSTLFNALLKRRVAETGPYPFTTVKPHTGVVKVPDPNLTQLIHLILKEKQFVGELSPSKETPSQIAPPEKVPATVTFVDIAGLVKGAHKGEGLGNEFLSQVRDVDLLVHVVREFDHPQVVHPMGKIDPLGDVKVISTELMLKDLDILEGVRDWKKVSPEAVALATKLINLLNQGKPISQAALGSEEIELVREFQLLTSKPILYLLNVLETDLVELKEEIAALSQKLKPCVVMCARLEEELADLPQSERQAYRRELGLRGSGLDRLISKAYELLGLITFYTIKGGKEVHAWPLPLGSTALDAAEQVHTDFARNFINAEVINVHQLFKQNSWHQAKANGKVRLEGKDYLVQNQDVIEFKTSKF